MPSVINNYRIKQLHTAFLRSSSLIQTALNNTAFEFGLTSIKDINAICGSLPENETGNCVNSNQVYFDEINNTFISQFRQVKGLNQPQLAKSKIVMKGYSGEFEQIYANMYGVWQFGSSQGAFILVDGSLITKMIFFYHGKYDGITFTFDTNGPFKGPNRYGYDIFIYNTGGWYKACTKNGTDPSGYKSRACYDYALKDVNPDDSSKGYWESLRL